MLTLLSTAGCAEREPAENLALPDQNRAKWTLPLDQYLPPHSDPENIAERLLVQPCMRKRGYDWAASAVELHAKPGESWNEASFKLFTVDLARKYGYGNSAELDLPVPVRDELHDIFRTNSRTGSSPAVAEVIDECFDEVRDQLGSAGEGSPYDLATRLAFGASDRSRHARPVKKAEGRWRTCMGPAGVPDLPAAPHLMPPSSISDLRPNVDAPTPNGEETNNDPEERRVAVADAECRESSGYAEAAYQAEWDEEVKALGANADELQRYAAQAEAINRRAEQAIAAYVPTMQGQ